MIRHILLSWLAATWIVGAAPAEVVKLGVVATGVQTPMRFAYKNTGAQPLLVEELATSCGCLTANGLPAVVEPGETLIVGGVYRADRPGKIEIAAQLLGGESRSLLGSYSLLGFAALAEWMVSVEEAAKRHANGELIFVDVRGPARYEEGHILGSRNEQVFAVKTRPEWRDRSLVLVDEGHNPEALLVELAALREHGFTRVQILDGGLAAWVRHGLPFEGPRTEAAEVAMISAAAFTRASTAADWRIVDWQDLPSRPLLVQALAQGGVISYLVVAQSNADYQHAERLLGSQKAARLYYLDGGAAQLAAFRETQAALAAHTGQTFQTISEPRTLGARSGGCGSCPKR